MKAKIFTFLLSFVIVIIIRRLLFVPPSIFNYFPYSIYHGLGIEIIEEYQFIMIFDLMISVLLLILIFKFFNKKQKSNLK